MEQSPKLWFKRKQYGWGWTPVSWQGWLVTALYIALVVGLGIAVENASSRREVLLFFVLPTLVLTTTLIRIAYKKGERPHWQWGKKPSRTL